MEKPTSTVHESGSELPPAISDAKSTGIKRKPVAKPAQAYISSSRVLEEVDCKQEYRRYPETPLPPRGSLPSQKRSFISRIQVHWSCLSRRAQISVLVAIVCVLVLVIGLSAGLASRSRVQNLPLPSSHGGPYNGDLTYYDPALGACGFTNSGSDAIVAVSHVIFDAVSVGSDPNANPLCGKKIRAKREEKSIDLTVVDRCAGCKATDIDVTRSVFADLASIDDGRVPVSWSWLEDVPGAAAQ